MSKKKVCYYYDSDVPLYYYGPGHPMKPYRLRLTNDLVVSYGLFKSLQVYKPHKASDKEVERFHDPNYVNFLKGIDPDNWKDYQQQLERFHVGSETDCPIFKGVYDFCTKTSGGSIDGAIRLNHKRADIAVNWAGGFHHAKKSEASGFCYVNDIVLSILELLKYHQRVLYVDTDIHHGDGVEEAFYVTDRVMTVSFHKYGDSFFPGSGSYEEIGERGGRNYAVNFPLQSGMTDESYEYIFKPIIAAVMERYRPEAIVLCSGADSIVGDPIGCFNLTLKGHGMCVSYLKSFGIPLLLLGGGGYNMRITSRCWAYETSLVLNKELPDNVPYNDNWHYFGPNFRLHLNPDPEMVNKNSNRNLEKTKNRLLQNLKRVDCRPSVGYTERIGDTIHYNPRSEQEEKEDNEPDTRSDTAMQDVPPVAEFYEGDQDQDPTPETTAPLSTSS